ncbi:MAG: M20/M25/M40 family metallo-hydrolase [Ardenticatenaceae bacterium]|nr:M20/M25/M40 family metallo-hydrolase [Ardenticatenaceae bacterium]
MDLISLSQTLIKTSSVSRFSNAAVSQIIDDWLIEQGFEVERLEYVDLNGERKVNLIAKLGDGPAGLAFCSHSDTVPGQEADWDPFDPVIKNGRLVGRGSCDMKGPLAATMIAAATIDRDRLKAPLYIVVTADEEVGLEGAKFVAEHSEMLRNFRPQYGVIAEPTRLIPVYGHKGFAHIAVTARGRAAHTSTGLGQSANFLIAPFMADMAKLAKQLIRDPSFANEAFSPPTNGFNMIVNDGNTRPNVTAPKTVVTLTYRVMPDARAEELATIIQDKAHAYGLECHIEFTDALYTSTDTALIKAAAKATGIDQPELVAYGTDGVFLQDCIDELIILGPGDIAVAHTVGESIPVAELEQAVEIYQQMIAELCY